MKYFLSYYCEITVLSIRFEIDMKKKVLKIAIIDADLLGRKKHRFPNLACEKISGYWKAQGASVELKLDYEGLDQYNKVFISKVFTDTPVPEGVLDLPNVEYGGTGFFFDKAPDLPCEIEHHMPDYHLYDDFINSHIEAVVALEATEDDKEAAYKHMRNEFKEFLDYSIGFVTRGCFRKCGFCVNKKYDRVFEHSPLSEFYDPSRPKICLLDDNFFGHPNWSNILQTLQVTGRPFKFKQGLDERLLTDEKCELLCKSKYDGDITFAFDKVEDYELIESKLQMIRRHTKKQFTFYVLVGFESQDERDIENAFVRIQLLMKYRCIPYIMRFEAYRNSPYRSLYINLARWCNQPRIFKKMSFRQFCNLNQAFHKTSTTTCSAMKSMLDFEAKHPEIVKKYFDITFAERGGL